MFAPNGERIKLIQECANSVEDMKRVQELVKEYDIKFEKRIPSELKPLINSPS